ncbi:MAG: hypothetical protein ABFC89_00935 [Methanospirillum sp.]
MHTYQELFRCARALARQRGESSAPPLGRRPLDEVGEPSLDLGLIRHLTSFSLPRSAVQQVEFLYHPFYRCRIEIGIGGLVQEGLGKDAGRYLAAYLAIAFENIRERFDRSPVIRVGHQRYRPPVHVVLVRYLLARIGRHQPGEDSRGPIHIRPIGETFDHRAPPIPRLGRGAGEPDDHMGIDDAFEFDGVALGCGPFRDCVELIEGFERHPASAERYIVGHDRHGCDRDTEKVVGKGVPCLVNRDCARITA